MSAITERRDMARGGVGGVWCEWLRGLGLGFTNPVGTGGVWDMCLSSDGVGHIGGGVSGWPGPGSGRMGWCYVCVYYESGLFV